MSGRGSRVVELHAGGRCACACPQCDCHSRPSTRQWGDEVLAKGAGRVVLRGDLLSSPDAAWWLQRARGAKASEVVVRTHAQTLDAARAEALRRAGVTGLLVPVFSHHWKVHDRLTGLPGSLQRTLSALTAATEAGLTVEVETPLLPARLQDLDALVSQVKQAAPGLRRVRFFLPRRAQPAAVAPAEWTQGRAHLVSGLEAAARAQVRVTLGPSEAIPLCALRHSPEHHRVFELPPRAIERVPGTALMPICDGCAVKARCAGVAASYAQAHGERGLEPWTRFPRSLSSHARTPATWTRARQEAARASRLLVLRPTINCNQDCSFCSANETTGNVWTARRQMLGRIARAAARGVRRVSFSGGEPTLSPHLPAYVRAARRLGIPSVELVTNAVLLDSQKRVSALAEAGLTHAFVSLHGHSELLSRRFTNKVGDFERTTRAVDLLLDAGVEVTLTHVVNAGNHRYLRAFVDFAAGRWPGQVRLSFAFVTPQYRALEHLELVPRLTDVMPDLRRALHRAVELRQPFVVGSRQGIPPCLLGEFAAWSDVFERAVEAIAEDSPQKLKPPSCASCRFDAVCAGVWKPYARRYGLDELVPVRGEPFSADRPPRARSEVLRSFDDAPEVLRDRVAEEEGRRLASHEAPLPVLLPAWPGLIRSRPQRIALFGDGRRARRLALAARHVNGLALAAVMSPHAPDADPRDFGHCPTFRTVDEVFEQARPEAVILASEPPASVEALEAVVAVGLPVLVERPVMLTSVLARLARKSPPPRVLVGHRPLFLPGLRPLLAKAGPEVSLAWRLSAGSEETLLAWTRAGLSELLCGAFLLAGHGAGELVEVAEVTSVGDGRPERLGVRLQWARRTTTVTLDFDASVEELLVDDGERSWRRFGREVRVRDQSLWTRVDAATEDEAMLSHFRQVALGLEAPAIGLADAVEAMRAVELTMEALDGLGVAFQRPNAPRHVASRPAAS